MHLFFPGLLDQALGLSLSGTVGFTLQWPDFLLLLLFFKLWDDVSL